MQYPKIQILKILFPLFSLTILGFSTEYRCKINKKFSPDVIFSEEDIRKWDYTVKIKNDGDSAILSRCGYSRIEKKETCTDYPADTTVFDERLKITKYYIFGLQLDIQVFPNLLFVENNGKGDIAFGKCRKGLE